MANFTIIAAILIFYWGITLWLLFTGLYMIYKKEDLEIAISRLFLATISLIIGGGVCGLF